MQDITFQYFFVHPTKCGGTAFLEYMKEHKLDIGERGHDSKCSDHPHPIIFLRDPVSRFISMYNYWKNGSERYPRIGRRFEKYSVDDYIRMIETSCTTLIAGFTSADHYAPQTKWISPDDYAKTIAVIHKRNLAPSIKELLEYIQFPIPDMPMGKVNVTNISLASLKPHHIEWIKKHYACDYELLDNLTQFRKVI